MPLIFKNTEERKQHPQASLISEFLWQDPDFFANSLDEKVLLLMQATPEELPELIKKTISHLRSMQIKKTAWLAIVFSHQKLDLAALLTIASQLGLNQITIFQLLAALENENYLKEFISQQSSFYLLPMILAHNASVFKIATQSGNLKLLKYFLSLIPPYQQKEIIKSTKIFEVAAEHGHLHILKYLKDLFPQVGIKYYDHAYKRFVRNSYLLAAKNSQLEVLDFLNTLKDPVSERMENVSDLLSIPQSSISHGIAMEAYREALEAGKLEVLHYLDNLLGIDIWKEKWEDSDKLEAIPDMLKKSAQNGDVALFRFLLSKVPNQTVNTIVDVYKCAAVAGCMEILVDIETKFPEYIVVMDKIHITFEQVAEKGHIEILKHMTAHWSGLEWRWIYPIAAEYGHPDVLRYAEPFLNSCEEMKNRGFDSDLIRSRISDSISSYLRAYEYATYPIHVDSLQYLESILLSPESNILDFYPSLVVKHFKLSKRLAFGFISFFGTEKTVKNFLRKELEHYLQNLLEKNFSFTKASASVERLDYLARKKKLDLSKIVKLIYEHAVENGCSSVLDYIENNALLFIPKPRWYQRLWFGIDKLLGKGQAFNNYQQQQIEKFPLEMVRSANYYSYYPYNAYRQAVRYGDVARVKKLESMMPNDVNTMIATSDFKAFQLAAENNHFDICWDMLSRSNECFAYAEQHVYEYGAKIVSPFVLKELFSFHQRASAIIEPDVFDIQDERQTKFCFLILRYLIRQNNREMNDELRFLLEIPSVKVLAHQSVDDSQSNELFRLALRTGNQEAAAILLTIPAIRELAEQNNYYRQEVLQGIDLAALANNHESSMVALTEGERKRLESAIKHYQRELDDLSVPEVMNALRAQLKARYEANPATIKTKSGKTIKLPMNFAELQALKLNNAEYELALKAYYQHKDHTAWRYLSKPNHWIHPDASYVYINDERTERWSTFEEYQPLISLLWLAAKDKTVAAIGGHTLDGRINHFIDELAHLGRAHNWDKSRKNKKGKEEEYDDGEGDKPSCCSGVKRRLFQSVIGHPLLVILTSDMVLNEARDFVRTHFEELLKEDGNKQQLKEALDDYAVNIEDMSPESQAILEKFNIPAEKLEGFEAYLSTKYGIQYKEDKTFHRLVKSKCFIKPESTSCFDRYHALLCDGLANINEIVGPSKAASQPRNPSARGSFFYQEEKNSAQEEVNHSSRASLG